jgi:hypothetical protein
MGLGHRFVLFELNEVPIRVVQHFADRHPRSSFARILQFGGRWDTITPDTGHLSPWITWPTLHRGVSSGKHHIVALGQAVEEADAHFPPVWSILARAGRRVGVFGSLHSYPLPADLSHYDFYVPDTFAGGAETKPAELSAFQRFNLQMVDRSGRNVSSEVPVKDALKFLIRAVPAGIRASTLAKVAGQVAKERVWRDRTGRRRTIQSLLAFDLFVAQLQAKRPDGAFFFTNHVASSMHRYWPATFADDYRRADWGDEWRRRFSGELDYVMTEADLMLGELMGFADRNPDYLILIAGSMGQAAVDDPAKLTKTEVLLRDMPKFLNALGITGTWERRRTMEPTYTLAFAENSSTDELMRAIADVKIAGEPISYRRLDARGVEFILGHKNVADEKLNITIGNRVLDAGDAGLANVVIDDEVGSAAYHVPEGMLLAYDPRQRSFAKSAGGTISTTRIAPTLLALQDVAIPSYMEAPIGELVGESADPMTGQRPLEPIVASA